VVSKPFYEQQVPTAGSPGRVHQPQYRRWRLMVKKNHLFHMKHCDISIENNKLESSMGRFEEDKRAILTCARWLSERGYFGCLRGSGGNISVKIHPENMIAITPTGQPYQSLALDDICLVDCDLNLIEGRLAPSIETAMHLGIYKSRHDINAVIHTHPVFASVLSIINQPIPALFDEIAFEIGESVEIIPYAISGSSDLAGNVVDLLDNRCFCYIMQNHGALSLGKNIDQAWKNAELLEKVAQVYFYALTTGRKITTLPPGAVERINKMRK
jgi:L-fuculose-phosphate aldolase